MLVSLPGAACTNHTIMLCPEAHVGGGGAPSANAIAITHRAYSGVTRQLPSLTNVSQWGEESRKGRRLVGDEIRPRKFEEQVWSGRDTSTVSYPGRSSRTGRMYALHVRARADVFAPAAYHAMGGGDWQISHQYQERLNHFLGGRMASHPSAE